jgi:membrane protease YdiL (CAAX protease family)
MPDDSIAVLKPVPAEPVSETPNNNRRIRWFELSLVILVAFGQHIFTSVYVLNGGQYPNVGDRASPSASWFFQESACLLLLGYVLYRRKLRFRDLGLVWSIRDLWRGLAVFVGSYLAYYAGYFLIHAIAYAVSSTSTGKQAFHWGVFGDSMLPLLLINPFFEELIVRAYLMTEVRELTGSPTLAVIASTVIQITYHLYYGWTGALSLGFMFLAFSAYYARTRRITPVILAHAVLDLSALFR